MEKILIAVDPRRENAKVIDFACFIAKLTRSELTAIFLDDEEAVLKGSARRLHELVTEPAVEERKTGARRFEEHISFFEDACLDKNVRASVHIDYGVPVKEILMESRFADLLIVDAGMPALDEILAKSECPVVIAPASFTGIDEILFVYDGTAASLFAIKQFAYLLPELSDTRTTVVELKTGNEELPAGEKKMLGSFLQMHYSSIGFRVLQSDPGPELLSYLADKKNVFVVTGSRWSGRNGHLPVFVTHL